ncbi:hypothetical protein SS50377_22067 [Spironucleus salmonicida]|uniref:Uncharacterized protein n=1 Tax=Spironucleus salmonicida TaxID=348837 RepID=V6LPY4_9EUKA|nr:hypothetical protein SS50377_22067 [Spironucleus salmonicida]|eukprot:EST45771.1 Hypothetical protein SS50377_jh019 [Spironucleus salmonicida]
MDSAAQPEIFTRGLKDQAREPRLQRINRPRTNDFKQKDQTDNKLHTQKFPPKSIDEGRKPFIRSKSQETKLKLSPKPFFPKREKVEEPERTLIKPQWLLANSDSDSPLLISFSQQKLQVFDHQNSFKLIEEYNLKSFFPFNFIFASDFYDSRLVFSTLNGLYLFDFSVTNQRKNRDQIVNFITECKQLIEHKNVIQCVKITRNFLLIGQNSIKFDENGKQIFGENELILYNIEEFKIMHQIKIEGYISAIALEEIDNKIRILYSYQTKNCVQIDKIILQQEQNETPTIISNKCQIVFPSYLSGFDNFFEITDDTFLISQLDQPFFTILTKSTQINVSSSKFTSQIGIPFSYFQQVKSTKFRAQIGKLCFSFAVTAKGVSDIQKVAVKFNMQMLTICGDMVLQVVQKEGGCILEGQRVYESRIQAIGVDVFL